MIFYLILFLIFVVNLWKTKILLEMTLHFLSTTIKATDEKRHYKYLCLFRYFEAATAIYWTKHKGIFFSCVIESLAAEKVAAPCVRKCRAK